MSVSMLLRNGLPNSWSTGNEVEEREQSKSLFILDIYPLSVTKVVSVLNPYLWQFYQLTKLQYIVKLGSVRELKLYHATSVSNVDSISKDNLDWRRVVRCKFGRGVSFSPDHNYANRYCNRNCGYSRALIVCKVLVGLKWPGYREIPPKGYDTTTGNGESVYVKYHDHEFYPEYVIYYNL